MDERVLSFLRRVYREHYFKRGDLVEVPPLMQSREFGYIHFGGGMIRHLSFRNRGELIAELVKQAPASVYCSNATYERPTLQMDEKGWLGAELIFDIDADSIPTACKASHDWWHCTECNKGGMGTKPSKCPSCRASGVEQVQWSCEECLGASKVHVKRLVDFLTDDFGIDRDRIRIYFSGNRGYHLNVEDERFDKADSRVRAELANYVMGKDLNVKLPAKDTKTTDSSYSFAWKRRSELFLASNASTYSKKQTQKLTDQIVAANAAIVDESVTTDVHRVFRMPGTLHGNSGMLKMRVNHIDHFDPQEDPVVLGDEKVKVRIHFSPEFYLKGTRFGPYDSSMVQMPIYAAVYLLARGLGSMADS